MTQKGHAPGTKQARASPKSNTVLRVRWGFGRVGNGGVQGLWETKKKEME